MRYTCVHREQPDLPTETLLPDTKNYIYSKKIDQSFASDGLLDAWRAKRECVNMSQRIESGCASYFIKVDESSSRWNKCLVLITLKSGKKSNLKKHFIKHGLTIHQENVKISIKNLIPHTQIWEQPCGAYITLLLQIVFTLLQSQLFSYMF